MPTNADKAIESIANITTHTDRELLETSLMSALFQLLELKRIALYTIIHEYGEKRCLLSSEVVEGEIIFHDPCSTSSQLTIDQVYGLAQCMEDNKPVFFDTESQQIYLHPLTNRRGETICTFIITGFELEKNISGDLLANYFKVYHNYVSLLDDSERDTLTGLLNRRTFERNLDHILSKWQHSADSPPDANSCHPQRRLYSSRKKNWLAEIDIDFFKRINDDYGHLYGDEVLLLLANIMRDAFRSYDKLFRFGGEEFVVILRSTDQAGAEMALERFRAKVEDYNFPQIEQVTVSIGYVEIANQDIPAAVLGHADEALYYAKENGRNRVCFHQDLIKQG